MTRRPAARDPWVWGQMLLFGIVLAGVPWVAAQAGTADAAGATRWVGGALIAVGLGTLWAGIATLGRNLTPATQPLPEGTLVTHGIYRVVRHPIYTGISVALAGYGVLRGGWWIGAAVFAVALAYFEGKARVEERWMTERAPEYAEYRRRVPRLLPGGWH